MARASKGEREREISGPLFCDHTRAKRRTIRGIANERAPASISGLCEADFDFNFADCIIALGRLDLTLERG